MGWSLVLPFGYQELIVTDRPNLPFEAIRKISFVILGTTFCTYLFNILALAQLKASTVSAFICAQPLIGILYAVAAIRILAACPVLAGVYLAGRKPGPQVRWGSSKWPKSPALHPMAKISFHMPDFVLKMTDCTGTFL